MNMVCMISLNKAVTVFLVILSLLSIDISSASEPIFRSDQIHQPVIAERGVIVSDDRYANMEGIKVLEEGGNAIDAAVTMGFVMAVTYPRAGNLGGGGFMLLRLAESGEVIALDYRETAPGSASPELFLDSEGRVDRTKTRGSVMSAGVPGTVAGLAAALEKYGTISLERALEPAINYAEKGFTVGYEKRNSLIRARNRMERSDESLSIFYKESGDSYDVGEIITQKDLAWTLEQIREHGTEAFYKGAVAEKIVNFMQEAGGIITMEDMSSYSPVVREPVSTNYRGYRVYSMPPPSAGGVQLLQILHIADKFDIAGSGHNSAEYIHILTEAMKLSFADRSIYLGDPDFSDIPVDELLSEKYASDLASAINPDIAVPSSDIGPGSIQSSQGRDTTHFTVIDSSGNVVSNTYTLNFSYGSGITVPGTGILLNNEMDDFVFEKGVPNAYGLIGGEKNMVEGGKRMLSSMAPVIVLKDDEPFLSTGGPGGSRIITTVLQVIVNVIDHGMNIATATAMPRFHHQWLPDTIYVETGISTDTLRILEQKGHSITHGRTIGSTNSVHLIDGFIYGSADPRRSESSASAFSPERSQAFCQ